MTEIPFAFFKQHVTDFHIPGEGEYAVGLFFSKERILGSEHEVVFKNILKAKGYQFLVIVMYQLIKMPLLNM